MHRRNFFLLAGATGVALTTGTLVQTGEAATAVEAGGYCEVPTPLTESVLLVQGTSLDQDMIKIAISALNTINGAPEEAGKPKKGRDWWVGPWFWITHANNRKIKWVNTDTVFGADFKTLSLSDMVAQASQSQYGTDNLALKVDRDGEVFISG